MDQSLLHQLGHHRGDTARVIIILAEIFAGGLEVDHQRHLVAVRLPVVDRQVDADVARDRGEMDRRVGRAADRRIDDDRVVERVLGEDVGGLQILGDHGDDALAGLVRNLLAVAVRRRDRGRSGQLHAERFGKAVHRRRGAHRVAIAGRRRRRGDELDEALIVDRAGREQLARLPDDRPRAGALALVPAVEHRSDRQRDRRDVHGRRRHQTGGRRLVAADRQHDAVERIAVEHLDQRQIGEVAVEPGGRALAGFLDRVDREFERDAAGFADALAQAFGEHEVVAIAGAQVAAGLRDADDRLARAQFLEAKPEVQIPLQIERRHVDILGVVEPRTAAEFRHVGHRKGLSGDRISAGDGEAIDHGVVIGLARIDACRHEARLVRRVGEFLRFQRDAVPHPVQMALLADKRSVEEIAGIELHARLGRQHLEHAARQRILQPRGQFRLCGQALVEREIMVVAMAIADLLVAAVADPLADDAAATEIEHGAGDGLQRAGRDQRFADRGDRLGGDRQPVAIGARRRSFAAQIEDRVVGHVDDRRLVGLRVIADAEIAGFVERVRHRDVKRAGIARIAVGAAMAEHQRRGGAALGRDDRPGDLVEAVAAAVQRIGLVVERELIGLAVEREAATRDPVGVAADRHAEEVGMIDIGSEVVIAEHDVGDLAVAVGAHQRLQRRAVGQDPCGHAVRVAQRHRLDRGAVLQGAGGGALYVCRVGRLRRKRCEHGCHDDPRLSDCTHAGSPPLFATPLTRLARLYSQTIYFWASHAGKDCFSVADTARRMNDYGDADTDAHAYTRARRACRAGG
ncbi:hypothetical protein SPHINGO391_460096 [Sphingomonas aurantiaca]|uniref:Uncharacterized protein n=1 Tax=Sphingomonas aurantiaca TaxID=185949 RepID=A0A5E7ZJS6_9SPHN|nr:hypothetical protein SPHINGO391_460096 [Sphingomonas aurantiaca]